jgi:hypothetical protein
MVEAVMNIVHDTRTPPVDPRPGQRTPSDRPERQATPTDAVGEFAKHFKEILSHRSRKANVPHQNKHSDYWMG